MRLNTVTKVRYPNEAASYALWFIILATMTFLFSPTVNSAVMSAAYTHQETFLKQQLGWQDLQQSTKLESAREAFSDEEVHLSYRLLKPLAMQGHTIAQYQLATLHDSDNTSYASSSEAAFWYQKAAKKGHKNAQHNLAVAYANGEGVKQDIKKAMNLWKRAAIAGHTDAQYNLGIIYATGNGGVKRDIVKAAKWWRLAAISGDSMAQYNLAALYANGVESVKSYCEATRWWEKSAQNGFTQASIALEVIKQKQDYYSCW